MFSSPVTYCDSPECVAIEAVEALAQMSDRDRVGLCRAADRQIEIDHRAARIVRWQEQLEAGLRPPGDHRIRMIRVDAREAAVGAQRQRCLLVMAREPVRVARSVEHHAPRFVDLPADAGLLRQRLRS